MKKIGIFYGSSTGTTQGIAETIASKLGVPASDVIDVSKMNADMVKEYEALLLGTSTWGDGELQDDWYNGVKVLKESDLKEKQLLCSVVVIPNLIAIHSAMAWVSYTKTSRIPAAPSSVKYLQKIILSPPLLLLSTVCLSDLLLMTSTKVIRRKNVSTLG